MKKVNILQINDKKYELYYTIGDLRKIERETGKSLISTVLVGSNIIERADIDFVVASLRHGLHDKEIYTDNQVEDFIDEYCSQQGNFTLDDLIGEVLDAIYNTGFFIHPIQKKEEKQGNK